MKKLFYVGALSALLLAACGSEDTSNEDVNKDAEENSAEETPKEEVKEASNVSETEIGKMTTIYQNEDLNMPIESGSIKGTLNSISYDTFEPNPDNKLAINDGETVTLITIDATVENTTDSNVSFYPDQATLVTDTNQEVKADSSLSDAVGGDFIGAVKKEGIIQWVLKHDENIKKVTLKIDSAVDEKFNGLSEDLKIEIPFE